MRIAFVGWGAIARRVAELLTTRNDDIAIAGIATRQAPASDRELPAGACWLPSPDALRDLAPDLVIEAAGRAAVEGWGLASLRHAPAFVVCSTSAFTDDALLSRLVDEAERCGSQILVPPGALGGLDALAAAGRLPLDRVSHRIVKPPAAWRGTAAEELIDLATLTSAQAFFTGTAREAAARFPANANVAVISALAGVGLDRTEVMLVADPAAALNSHHLSARGDFGSLSVTVENRPFAANPKTSELTALSVVRLIEGRSRSLSL
ncbi:aspartate dehydrogenase [Bradyrhizobium sp. 2TAF24]|uniref:aspartate dehydrogenase n=1 Tax=Bradyrhizobium sp. 2TAF24 TaxID=3233011 RepID=UPI003F91CDE6